VAIATFVSGLFGMNLWNGIDSTPEDPLVSHRVFRTIAGGTSVLVVVCTALVYVYLQKQGILAA
jgi:Mg2+ and Co2+ transporter CorA